MPESPYPPPQYQPVLIRSDYFVDRYVRTLITLFSVISMTAVITIVGAPKWISSLEIVHPSPLFFEYLTATTLPSGNFTEPFWEQFLTYVFNVGTWWPFVLVVVGAGVLTLLARRT